MYTLVPGFKDFTLLPTSSTTPETSEPGMKGRFGFS